MWAHCWMQRRRHAKFNPLICLLLAKTGWIPAAVSQHRSTRVGWTSSVTSFRFHIFLHVLIPFPNPLPPPALIHFSVVNADLEWLGGHWCWSTVALWLSPSYVADIHSLACNKILSIPYMKELVLRTYTCRMFAIYQRTKAQNSRRCFPSKRSWSSLIVQTYGELG